MRRLMLWGKKVRNRRKSVKVFHEVLSRLVGGLVKFVTPYELKMTLKREPTEELVWIEKLAGTKTFAVYSL